MICTAESTSTTVEKSLGNNVSIELLAYDSWVARIRLRIPCRKLTASWRSAGVFSGRTTPPEDRDDPVEDPDPAADPDDPAVGVDANRLCSSFGSALPITCSVSVSLVRSVFSANRALTVWLVALSATDWARV